MLQSGHGSRDRRTDGQTDRRTDGRTEWNQYTPQQLRCSGGIINCMLLNHTAKRFWIFMWWKICRIFLSPYTWYRTVILQQAFGNLYQWLLCIDIYCLSGHRNMYIFAFVCITMNIESIVFIYVCTYGHFKRWWILQTLYLLSFIAYRCTWILLLLSL